MVTRFKSFCFKLGPMRGVSSFQYSEGFWASVWDRYSSNIASDVGNYWFVAVIVIYKTINDGQTSFADHASFKYWLSNRSHLSSDMLTWVYQLVCRPWPSWGYRVTELYLCCIERKFVCSNSTSYIKRAMQAKGIWKQDPEENIWAQEE